MQAISAHPEKTSFTLPTLTGLLWWSLAIHAIVLLAFWNQVPKKPLLAGEPLSIALISQSSNILKAPETLEPDTKPNPILQKSVAARHAPEKNIATKEKPLKEIVDENKALVSTENLITSLQPAYIKELGKTNNISSKTEDQLQTSLGKRLRKYFYYPRLARKKGWQGKVKLELRVEGSGHLSHIRLIQSSGYASLDDAALKSLRKVAFLPEARNWLQGTHYDIVVPVEYRLVDS